MAKLEIEKKFLLKSLPKIDPIDVVQIEQFYLKRKSWERMRTWESSLSGDKKWIHTIKKTISKGVNLEDESYISEEEFNHFKDDCFNSGKQSKMIRKTRYIYPHTNKLLWEIDQFHNDYQLIIAEIEIPTKDYKVDFPKWISDLILLEVTGLKQFSNRSLSLKIK